jgi:putative acetyltransferase
MIQSELRIRPDSPAKSEVRALVSHHFATARAATDEASAHALDADSLTADNIRFWSVWRGDNLVGIGALQALSPEHGEVKSMHTVESASGTGVADTLLCHILEEARRSSFQRLSLETGSMASFAPARALYRKHGFVECAPFADYTHDPNSTYMTRALTGTGQREA